MPGYCEFCGGPLEVRNFALWCSVCKKKRKGTL